MEDGEPEMGLTWQRSWRGRPEGSSRNPSTCPTRKRDSDQCGLEEQFRALMDRNGLSWLLSLREFTCSAEDAGLIPGLERSPGERNGNPLQHSCLGNLMNRGTWQATVHRVAESWTQLSNQTTTTAVDRVAVSYKKAQDFFLLQPKKF